MRLRGRLNQIERRITAIKAEFDDTELVATGVHYLDDDGKIIPGGPASRVPIEQVNVFGVLLVPEPCQDREEFEAEYQKMAALQESRKEVMMDQSLSFDEKLEALDLPKSFLNCLQGGKKCEEYQQQIEQGLS